MTNPIIRIHNAEIDEVVDREMNDDEYKSYLNEIALYEAKQQETITKAEAKELLLKRLNITEDDVRILLS
jgi:hypothetical protein